MRRTSTFIATTALVLSGFALAAPGVSAASNWSSVTTGYLESQKMDASDDGKYVLISGWTQLHASSDSGSHFNSSASVLSGYWGTVAVSSNGGVMLADNFGTNLAARGLWKSTDHGASWTRDATLTFPTYSTSMSDDARIIFTTDSSTGKLWSSIDSGSTWNLNSLDLGSPGNFATAHVSPDGSTVVASVSDVLFISRNQGSTWTPIRDSNASTHIISAVAVSKNGSTIAFTENGLPAASGMFVSKNYGITWESTKLPGTDYYNGDFIAISDDGTQIIASTISSSYTNIKIYRSVNSGSTWSVTLDGLLADKELQGIHSSQSGELVTIYLQDTNLYIGAFPKNKHASALTYPSISGKATSTASGKNKLRASTGKWSGFPTPTFSYQWYSCSAKVSAIPIIVPRKCKPISKATKSTLALTKKFKGKYIVVAVTGKSAGTSATTWLSKSTAKVK